MKKDLLEKYKTRFIPGIKLNQMFHDEAVSSIMKKHFPEIPYSAALLGPGSDTLGFDTPVSMEHEWGPRFYIFLSDENHEKYREKIHECLRRNLPLEFSGFPVNFEGYAHHNNIKFMSPVSRGPVNHRFFIFTIKYLFEIYLGVNPYEKIDLIDWLTLTEQSLLLVTAGKVYYDGLGELNKIRDKFSYYPEDIWLYKMLSQWKRCVYEGEMPARCGDVGDNMGSQITAARLIREMMKLCFLMEKKYAPYSKWLGTAFAKLENAKKLLPLFENTLKEESWQKRSELLCHASSILVELHNKLGITDKVETKIDYLYGRPYKVLFTEEIEKGIKKAMRDEKIKNLPYPIGSVDQYTDSVLFIRESELRNKLKTLYENTSSD